MFEPVAGERFDQIVSNPPFVITPRVADVPAYEYRDGGMVGDALVEAVVRGGARRTWRRAGSRSCSATGSTSARRRAATGRAGCAGWSLIEPALDAWVVQREAADRRWATPRRGSATAAHAPATPRSSRCWTPGSTTSPRAT